MDVFSSVVGDCADPFKDGHFDLFFPARVFIPLQTQTLRRNKPHERWSYGRWYQVQCMRGFAKAAQVPTDSLFEWFPRGR
jgi:hypothetical protein